MFPGSNIVYDLMYLVGFAVMMAMNVKRCGHFGIPVKKAVGATLWTYVAGVAGAALMGAVYTAISHWSGSDQGSRVAIFGAVLFTPVMLTIIFLLQKKDWRLYLDMLTPGIFIILACAKLGCFLNGCCAGVECVHGIYNPVLQKTVFPIQLTEAVSILAVTLLAMLWKKKSRRLAKGALFPLTAALYSVTRFFWEFARYYENDRLRHLFLSLTFWQICCLVVFLGSAVMLAVLHSARLRDYDRKKEEERRAAEVLQKTSSRKKRK